MHCIGSVALFLAIKNVVGAPVAADYSVQSREAKDVTNDPDTHGNGGFPPRLIYVEARETKDKDKDVTDDPDLHGNGQFPHKTPPKAVLVHAREAKDKDKDKTNDPDHHGSGAYP